MLKLGEIQRRTPMASWERKKRLCGGNQLVWVLFSGLPVPCPSCGAPRAEVEEALGWAVRPESQERAGRQRGLEAPDT